MTKLEGIIHNLDEATYHARPELSSTEARLLLDSPAKYRWRKDNPPLIDPSDKFDVGSAVHAKVLGTGYEVDVLDFDNYLTKAAREARDESRAAGRVPILRDKFLEVETMAESVLAHPDACAYLDQPGDAEVSVFAEVDGVPVRARFDFLPEQGQRRRIAVDLKTTISAAKRDVENSVAKYGYFIQRAWYLDALNAVTGPMPVGMEPEMVFVFVEKDPPYRVKPYMLPMLWAQKGHEAAAEARQSFIECTASGVWPSGLGDGLGVLDEPVWFTFAWEERHETSGEIQI